MSFSIKGRVYPAILPVENKKVLGRVLTGVTNHELNILDIFEDVEYVRDSVEVTLEDTLEKLQAYAYVWDNKDDPDLYGDWDFEVTFLSVLYGSKQFGLLFLEGGKIFKDLVHPGFALMSFWLHCKHTQDGLESHNQV